MKPWMRRAGLALLALEALVALLDLAAAVVVYRRRLR